MVLLGFFIHDVRLASEREHLTISAVERGLGLRLPTGK